MGALLGAAAFSAALLVAFGALSIHRKALRERERALQVLRAARWNTGRAERFYRAAKQAHAHCRASPFAINVPQGSYPMYRGQRGVS